MRRHGAWLAAVLWLGCASAPVYELPEERTGGQPLAQAPYPRSGRITWRPGPISSTSDGLRIELTLMNGTSRDYANLMLRLVLRGPGRQMASVRYPSGPLSRFSTRVVRAHLAPPGFEVKRTRVELLWAQE